MVEEILALAKNGWTPGGVGIWLLVVMAAGVWWKGLPAVLDAWTKRSDREAERISKEFERLERQIEAGEKRHGECEIRCERLQAEVTRLHQTIKGMMDQMRQLQVSAIRVGMDEPPSVTSILIAELDKVPSGDLRK